MRACVRACVRVCVRACVCVCVKEFQRLLNRNEDFNYYVLYLYTVQVERIAHAASEVRNIGKSVMRMAKTGIPCCEVPTCYVLVLLPQVLYGN